MSNPSDDLFYTRHGSLKLAQETPRPDVYDVVICGGGPCGTTAAMRARELGLSALVIDYDDLMKRIRDYPKEKLILPSYGGGDKTPFPGGEKLVEALYFDDIDKDDLVAQWKARYREAGTPARIGSELTGLEPRDDGAWEVVTWNHRAGAEMRYVAKKVIVAVGAGVPRRFDIPGDTDGIAFRLDDARNYVAKGPVLVIGGGTSAAEAVISLSNAKANAEDDACVFWSYRGTKMPKISKALGDVFFDAYVGNGNIRYLPLSDATAVVKGPDRRDYLSILVDRKVIEGRPAESVHYEFPKENVIALIGTDLPVKLLQRLGIKVPLENDQARMLVDRDGMTSLPGIYLAGDARGPRYLRCAAFDDPATYERVNVKRNIKAAMTDAVEVVEAVARSLGVDVPATAPGPTRRGKKAAAAPAEAPAAAAPAAAAPVMPPVGTHPAEPPATAGRPTVVMLHPDGSAEEEFPLTRDVVEIGRKAAGISCPEEPYMADHHATLEFAGGACTLRDTGAGSGVWLRVQGSDGTPLQDGDQLWLGSQVLVVARDKGGWSLVHYDREGVQRASHRVGDKALFVGRGSELPLDPDDMLLSRRHAQFVADAAGLRVYDRGARNGSYLRVRESTPLRGGDEFRLATKRFRLENVAAVERLPESTVVIDAPPEPEVVRREEAPLAPAAPAARAEPAAAAAAAQPAAAPAAGGAPVEFQHSDYPASWAVPEGRTILQAYMEQNGTQDEPLGWECKKGVCGLCCVEIVEGAGAFQPVDEGSSELKTIQIAVGVEPNPAKYRLACLSRIHGPVKLRVPE